MNQRFLKSGVTLIEVVASLFLCGLLFSVVIGGFTRHRQQMKQAQLILESTRELDLLVAGWYQQGTRLPLSGSGVLNVEAQLTWKLTPTATEAELTGQQIQKCRLSSWHEGKEVCGIELLVELPDESKDRRDRGRTP